MSAAPGETDVIVVGAGQAGLSLSYHLRRVGLSHVVLERDRPFSSWHHRWDGFHANTPNWMNALPRPKEGLYPGRDRDGLATKQELLDFFQGYVDEMNPPVEPGCHVSKVRRASDGTWEVHTQLGIRRAGMVAVCTGAMAVPRIPTLAAAIDPGVPQLHSSDYRNPEQLQTPEVLLVGSGSSGVQICKELCRSGRFRRIHFSTSDILVLPRHVCGIQIHRFLHMLGFFDVRTTSPIGRLMYSRLETKGDPIVRPHPRDLARQYGVELYGKLQSAEPGRLRCADGKTLGTDGLTVLWCSGYRPNYGWIANAAGPLALDRRGYPIHERGVVQDAPGLYFLGLRYQHTVASHDIYGVGHDAEYIANHMAGRLVRHPATTSAVCLGGVTEAA